ncbi:MAG: type II secretion system F family protein, partial [Planctomycetota bacterium]
MRKLIDAVADELEAGVSIEEAFEKRQKYFPPLYGRILKAGVETGRLSEMLTSLNRHLETGAQTRRIIFEAITYPGMILVTAIVVATLVFSFIVPQFEPILTEMVDGQLPALTVALFAGARNWLPFWIVVAVLAVAALALAAVLSSSRQGRMFRESIVLRLPIIGRIYRSGLL